MNKLTANLNWKLENGNWKLENEFRLGFLSLDRWIDSHVLP